MQMGMYPSIRRTVGLTYKSCQRFWQRPHGVGACSDVKKLGHSRTKFARAPVTLCQTCVSSNSSVTSATAKRLTAAKSTFSKQRFVCFSQTFLVRCKLQ